MNQKTLICFVIATVFAASNFIFAQESQKFTAAKHNEYGLIYSLPITHFDITVTATKTVKVAGIYNKYAKKYLGVENAILDDSQSWELQSIELTPYGVPDKDNEYLMQFKNGSSPFLMLDNNGLPLAINYEVRAIKATKIEAARIKNAITPNAAAQALSGELLVSESIAKQAEIAANQIYKIRESRTNFITGEGDVMPPDGEAMKLMISKLDAQEAALMALFLGTTSSETEAKHFDYTPSEEVNNEVILRISDYNGIVDKNDLSGEPVYLTLKITQRGEMPVNEKGIEKKIPKGAVMYKIPGKAQITLKHNGKSIFDKNIEVAQYGIDFGLDPDMFTNKKQPAYVIFDPQTGAVKEIGNANQPTEK
ncbi:MAG: DUF4831 family protein [Muribaculaceae bacterium]